MKTNADELLAIIAETRAETYRTVANMLESDLKILREMEEFSAKLATDYRKEGSL